MRPGLVVDFLDVKYSQMNKVKFIKLFTYSSSLIAIYKFKVTGTSRSASRYSLALE